MLITQQFEEFSVQAANYCSFIEKDVDDNNDFIETLQFRLLTLYQIACQLPEVPPNTNCKSKISEFEFTQYLPKLSNLLEFQYYWQVLDPFNTDNVETGCGDILDDLGDIYKDLKRELHYLNSKENTCKEHGYWMVKFDFDYHWGEHCINALMAIHHYKMRT